MLNVDSKACVKNSVKECFVSFSFCIQNSSYKCSLRSLVGDRLSRAFQTRDKSKLCFVLGYTKLVGNAEHDQNKRIL